MKKQTRNGIVIAAVLLLAIVALLFTFHPYFKKPTVGGSAQADLFQELAAIYGEEYEGKVISEKDVDGETIQIREDMHFTVEGDKYRPWNDTMVAEDPSGVPLSQKRWITVYTVKVEFTRYATLHDEAYGDVTEQKVISYPAYEDNDEHSVARATLDQSAESCQYSTSADRFDNLQNFVN